MDVDGQTDKENRPKFALTKCKVVPGRQERERLDPSQANTFFLELASPILVAMASRRIVLTSAIITMLSCVALRNPLVIRALYH